MIYKLYCTAIPVGVANAAMTVDASTARSFLFNLDNSDYVQFKVEINNESAQLEDMSGILMTPEQAKAYVATLP